MGLPICNMSKHTQYCRVKSDSCHCRDTHLLQGLIRRLCSHATCLGTSGRSRVNSDSCHCTDTRLLQGLMKRLCSNATCLGTWGRYRVNSDSCHCRTHIFARVDQTALLICNMPDHMRKMYREVRLMPLLDAHLCESCTNDSMQRV